MRITTSLMSMGIALVTLSGASTLFADTVTMTGNFAADNSVYATTLTLPATEEVTASTTSFAAGGFFPDLTIFSISSGNVVALSNTDVDTDAYLQAVLGPGTYQLDLTEFPNVAIGGINDGFLFAGDPTITGDSCSDPGGMFLDVITCTQRTSAYALSVSTAAVPEPATIGLGAVALLAVGLFGRRKSTVVK